MKPLLLIKWFYNLDSSSDLANIGSAAFVDTAQSMQKILTRELNELESEIDIQMVEIQFVEEDEFFDAHVIFTIEVAENEIENFLDELGAAAVRMTGGKYEMLNANGEFILKGRLFKNKTKTGQISHT